MSPTATTVTRPKGKKLKSKVPPNSAPPLRQKRKVKCSKCTKTHAPPTGSACQQAPGTNLSSTLAEEETPAAHTWPSRSYIEANPPPAFSPVRSDPNAIPAQVQLAFRPDPGAEARLAQLIDPPSMPGTSQQSGPDNHIAQTRPNVPPPSNAIARTF